jgi:phasin family protein
MAEQSNPFADLTKLVEQFKVPGVDPAAIIEAGRKDMEALVAANKAAYEGLQAFGRKQGEMLRDALQKIQAAAQSGAGKPAAAKPAETASEAYRKILADMKELADIVRKSQADAMTKVTDRAIEHLQELRKLLQPK